jgi:hypothetical protein
MSGSIFPLFPPGYAPPSATYLLSILIHVGAPILAVAVVWWLVNQTERVIHWLFPNLEWEHSLGWLNIRAQKRADMAMRWLGYGIYAILIGALYGIIWGAEGLRDRAHWSDPWILSDLMLRLPVLFICFGIWCVYLGGGLLPNLRHQREKREWAELQKFREDAEQAEKRRRMPSRGNALLPKPRTNAPLVPDRKNRRWQG